MILYIIEFIVIIVFLLTMLTQIMMPIWRGELLFPILRRNKLARENAQLRELIAQQNLKYERIELESELTKPYEPPSRRSSLGDRE